MSLGHLAAVAKLDLKENLRRPLFWIWMVLLGLMTWQMAGGNVTINSGDSSVGGDKAHITSQYANGQILSLTLLMFYGFFIAVASGMTVIRDGELKVGEVIHSTALRPSEYVWGKFSASLISFIVVLIGHLGLMILFNHVLPNSAADSIRGSFALENYLVPAVAFGLPMIVFLSGAAFAIGTRTLKPILVFLIPVALFLSCGFFLWQWSPSWLAPWINSTLMAVDPTGFRWINETWLKVDQGVEFYNQQPIGFDALFIGSRLAFAAIGLLAVFGTQRRLARVLRGAERTSALSTGKRLRRPSTATEAVAARRAIDLQPLRNLSMRSKRSVGLISGILTVARFELKELRHQPGLYLFVPLILLQAIVNATFETGAFETPILHTSGTLAVGTMGWLTGMVCLLLTFYTVESLRRERGTGLHGIYYASPLRTFSLLFGKSLANSLVGVVVLLSCFVACLIVMLIQGQERIELLPFAVVWGLLLVPTFIFWTTFTMAIQALFRNRFTTYGVAIAVLIYAGEEAISGDSTWTTNWTLWGTLQWSDMEWFELNRGPLLLNRLLLLTTAVFLTVFALRIFNRIDFDATRTLHRLRPKSLLKSAVVLLPFALPSLVLIGALHSEISDGYQSDSEKERQKDYWRKNLATYHDYLLPEMEHVELEVELEPADRFMAVKGYYDLTNRQTEPLRALPVTPGFHFESMHWQLDGVDVDPEEREGLLVFEFERPIRPGEDFRLGFEYEGVFHRGFTRNGGGASQFVLDAGVVLTSFQPSFAPALGFIEGIGVDDENEYEAKDYPDDFYEGVTKPAFGLGQGFTTRIAITAPPEFRMHSVGVLTSDVILDKRTMVWESDHPVRFFNIVGGKWALREGEGTAIYYHPEHDANIDEMIRALDASRKYYSEWFYPYPWQELRLNEFAALAGYAQGFPTNITFSENIGFLTRSDSKANAAFLVTAHEAAHQWWGNLLTPGEGPGGNILAEGTSHFSTILLFEQVLGLRERIELCKRLEEQYGDQRVVDSERPLVKIDGTRAGDQTVTYDKGGWVFWMMLNVMGRDAALEGIRNFIREWSDGPDYPLLQDFVAALRPYAPDIQTYDDFVQQWFFEVVMPEYAVHDAVREPSALRNGSESWTVRCRLANLGTGTMPVEVAISRGKRFPEDESAESAEAYVEQRLITRIPAEGETELELQVDFEPERIVIDPDAKILQLRRESARHEF